MSVGVEKGEVRKKAGRPRLLSAEDEAWLLERAAQDPHVGTRELAVSMSERRGRRVQPSTIGETLRRLGVKKVKPTIAPKVPPARRYGYTDAHRRKAEACEYPSSVTDVEWAMIRDLFERQGPGRPEKFRRRLMFDAIQYVVRSGCAWRMLPKGFPPWQAVYATFRRWSDDGLFERMHDRMRALWREREGRSENPTASVLDSQSVRTAEKGGPMDSMPARRSKDENVTC